MRFAYGSSFLDATKQLSQADVSKLLRAIAKFEKTWEAKRFPRGLGLKHLREEFYEFRVDLRRRVIFQRGGDLVVYLLYGDHDEIGRVLKRL